MLKTSAPVDPALPNEPGAAWKSPGDWARDGWSHARDKDLLGALQCFQQALDGDIDSYEAWLGLAQIFVDLHDTSRAVRCLAVARRLRQRLPIGRPATA